MTAKTIKDYLNKGVRRLRHRKGFGVHSPFAFSIITDVIEEKSAYYAYANMSRTYGAKAPIPFKVACLLLRLANHFKARRILEVSCDGGYSILPVLLTDSRNAIISIADSRQKKDTLKLLSWYKERFGQLTFFESLSFVADDYRADLMIVSSLPPGFTQQDFAQWVLSHTHETSLIFVKGIQPKQPLVDFWDSFFDHESIDITMDLYDYGLAIRKPRFYKQHYVVSF